MRIGYARVSTREQELDLQLRALKNAGCEKIFYDVASGTAKAKRPGLAAAIEQLQPNSTLVVWKLDRLGRNTIKLILLIDQLRRENVQFVSITENIDTSSALGKVLLAVIAAFAEFERDTIAERTQAGIAAAKARGSRLGRPRAIDDDKYDTAITLLKSGKYTVPDVAKKIGVSRSTLYRALRV